MDAAGTTAARNERALELICLHGARRCHQHPPRILNAGTGAAGRWRGGPGGGSGPSIVVTPRSQTGPVRTRWRACVVSL
eukprot:4702268-Pyramimonas_sp.AAC.1